MEDVKEFVVHNFKMLSVVLTFILTMYIQHVNNTARITELTDRCNALDIKLADQYDRIDAIKLDKAVFEATMSQLGSLQADVREMRNDIRELLMMQK
ncbi:MAG: hypothetical protein LUD40_13420 [Phocaeicola dorei]|nr:hypothetical protein [Phocaeicola dorei]